MFFDGSNLLKPHEKRKDPKSKTMKAALEDADDDFVEFIQLCLEWYHPPHAGTPSIGRKPCS